MAKTMKKKRKATASEKTFEVRLFEIRDAIDAVAAKIQEGKRFAGNRKENAREVAHANAMLASLKQARTWSLRDCCQNDQGCTLFFKKAPR